MRAHKTHLIGYEPRTAHSLKATRKPDRTSVQPGLFILQVLVQSAMQRTLLPITSQYSPRCSWFEPELKVRCMTSPSLVVVELQ